MDARRWECWEPAPAGRVPGTPGPWRDSDGTPLHGVWGEAQTKGTRTVVVANNGHALLGWRVPGHCWHFTSERVRASNCALAQIPWVWSRDGRLVASDSADVAVGLVLAGRKPAALADCADEHLARSWDDAARDADLRTDRFATTFDCGPEPVTRWFVRVAIAGTLAEHFDLDALLDDYAACLPGAQLSEVERALWAIAGEEISDLIAHPDRIMAATPGELATTGLLLGYHPATTVALILGAPRIRWADDGMAAAIVNEMAPLATPVALPGIASSLEAVPAQVR